MRTKKRRKSGEVQVLKVPQNEKKGSSVSKMDSPNLSAVDIASFMEGLQQNNDNPLHSTAMEDGLNITEERRKGRREAEKNDAPQSSKTFVQQHGPAAKRKKTKSDEENMKAEDKKRRSSTGGKVKVSPEKEGEQKKAAPHGRRGQANEERKQPGTLIQNRSQPTATGSGLKPLVGKKPVKSRGAKRIPAQRSAKNQQRKRDSKSGGGKYSDAESQGESDSDKTQWRRRTMLSSDNEVEDESWKQSPKKAKMGGFGKVREDSSDNSESAESSSDKGENTRGDHQMWALWPRGEEKADRDKQRRRVGRAGTELELVLDAFLDFCEQYRDSVESKSVKQSIDFFSSNVKKQLMEKMSSYEQLKVVKRETAKVGSLIRRKTQRLMDAKYEQMRAKGKMKLLRKQKTELEVRLDDLRKSQALLRDIRELNRQYLDDRHQHPRERETYEGSSLPALQWETKHIQTAEHQLRTINNHLEKRLKTRTEIKWK